MSRLHPKQEMLSVSGEEGGGGTGQTGDTVQIREEEKMPLFLIKLWNIVEDPAYHQIVHWDESGYSFHIVDPYSFCRNVLPHYFKHNNLNSLIRQLNMYGFRKMTPLDRSGLTRAESDQDHLEFSHPFFVRDHPELLINIKRKSSNRQQQENSGSSSNLSELLDEVRSLREKQRTMDSRMGQLVKENEAVWEQISHMRAQHMKQQQVVTKLVQFLVALVHPQQPSSKRLAKRSGMPPPPLNNGLLALEEQQPSAKRARTTSSNTATTLSDVLDRLQREVTEQGAAVLLRPGAGSASRGPIIADVTEEFDPASMATPQAVISNAQSPPGSHNNHGNMYGAGMVPQPQYSMPGGVEEAGTSQADLNSFSPINPTISLSPSLDRQLSAELQEYLNGMNSGIDSCRDLIGSHWDLDFPDLAGYEEEDRVGAGAEHQEGAMGGGYGHHLPGQQLALENGAAASAGLAMDEAFPTTPQLLTPSTSPRP